MKYNIRTMPKHNGILMDCNDYAVAVITAIIDLSAWRNITLTHWQVNIFSYPSVRWWPPHCHHQNSQAQSSINLHLLLLTTLSSSQMTLLVVASHATNTGSFNLIHKNFNPGSHESHDSDIKIYHIGQDNSTFHITDTLVNPTIPAASLTGIFGMDSYFLDIYLNLITILCKERFDNECNAIILPLACGTQCYTTSWWFSLNLSHENYKVKMTISISIWCLHPANKCVVPFWPWECFILSL